jgi:hypothetical protein
MSYMLPGPLNCSRDVWCGGKSTAVILPGVAPVIGPGLHAFGFEPSTFRILRRHEVIMSISHRSLCVVAKLPKPLEARCRPPTPGRLSTAFYNSKADTPVPGILVGIKVLLYFRNGTVDLDLGITICPEFGSIDTIFEIAV